MYGWKPEITHKCEGVTGWDEIYVDREREWVLSLDGGDGITAISFCPYCGVEMKTIWDKEE